MTKLDNLDKLFLRLKTLKEFVADLKKFQGVTQLQLESNKSKAREVDRTLELTCECVLDISRLIVSDLRLPVPENSKGYILALGKAGILEADFAMSFAPIAGFRNILVHMYLNIDYGEVADKINNRLEDFEIFSKSIAKYYEE
ncbi:DUF86 domain-containing protein [Candidatus Amesbacteria bacterium]|nr:DUF86 domain-containing protein [Candidatus Amesbacteria bacterium]